MSAKTFLLQECENVEKLLAQTLRHDYGFDGSRGFYEECATRLEFISNELKSAADTDTKALYENGGLLNDLASLICRIERSSIGEYSWPFVEELKKIAKICEEKGLGGTTFPMVYVLAEGGLDVYRIYLEQGRPSASRRRILTIVFPKSLKHFVLLHPILGHEIGHAIWRCSKHQATLTSKVISVLADSSGIFANAQTTIAHVYSNSAPREVKDYLSILNAYGINATNLFEWARWDAWLEEILCDLIGLATFGPSFVGAHSELLYSLDPTGVQFGREHPPVAWRVNFIVRAAKLLKYDVVPQEHSQYAAIKKFWDSIDSYRKGEAWFDVFSDEQLKAALEEIKVILGQNPESAYPTPEPKILEQLIPKLSNLVPPIGFSIDSTNEPVLQKVDFRHIIYCGWIVSRNTPDIPFSLVNKLCEYAVMQQMAIDVSLNKVA